MGTTTARAARAALAVAGVIALAGCATTVTGKAMRAPDAADSDGAVVALMNTGPYPTAAGHPFGAVGPDDVAGRGLLEAQRMAEFVVGPWEVDAAIRARPDILNTSVTGPVSTAELLTQNQVLPDPMPAVAAAHNFIAGFSTLRVSPKEAGQYRGLQNVVLRFADPAAAAAAAAEMADKNPPPPGAPPGAPVQLVGYPEAIAKAYDLPFGIKAVQSFTAHGPFVLFQSAQAADALLGTTPRLLAESALQWQLQRIDQFTPTPLDKLADLPLDPTGQLLAHTLWAPDNDAPFIIGAWKPRAWLHFEDDPVQAAKLFGAAAVDAVAQRLATVYEGGNAEGAASIVDEFTAQMGASKEIKPTDGVPGMPSAKCFERLQGALPDTTAASWRRVAWHYKCVARADHYAFTAFSTDKADVKQQMSAQYRILAGK
jgi:hypothetical protein